MQMERSGRKSTLWTKEKIAQLIKLYHRHECLCNFVGSDYDSSGTREGAAMGLGSGVVKSLPDSDGIRLIQFSWG